MSSTLIVNARLVNEGREFDGDLRIADGRIAADRQRACARAATKPWSTPPAAACCRA